MLISDLPVLVKKNKLPEVVIIKTSEGKRLGTVNRKTYFGKAETDKHFQDRIDMEIMRWANNASHIIKNNSVITEYMY